jgi:hypothetical protein
MVATCDSEWRLKEAVHCFLLASWPHILLYNFKAMDNLFWSTIPSFPVQQAITKLGKNELRENITCYIFRHQKCLLIIVP